MENNQNHPETENGTPHTIIWKVKRLNETCPRKKFNDYTTALEYFTENSHDAVSITGKIVRTHQQKIDIFIKQFSLFLKEMENFDEEKEKLKEREAKEEEEKFIKEKFTKLFLDKPEAAKIIYRLKQMIDNDPSLISLDADPSLINLLDDPIYPVLTPSHSLDMDILFRNRCNCGCYCYNLNMKGDKCYNNDMPVMEEVD
jgi:hypothetical protein